MSNPFREAKVHLAVKGYRRNSPALPDTADSICSALLIVARLGKITPEERRKATQQVQELLEGRVFITGWIRANVPGTEQYLDAWREYPPKVRDKIQVTRHAWIDWLADKWDKEHS